MPVQTFPPPAPELYKSPGRGSNRDKDAHAMEWMSQLNDCMYRCRQSAVEYGQGSWGYTVLRTAYSEEADALWPTAMDRLTRWVAEYFVHENRLATGKSDGSVNAEVGRRFVLDVVEASENTAPVLKEHPDLSRAGQEDINALTAVFTAWVQQAVGEADVNPAYNARFSDFLVIDEASLRSLAALPAETPSLEPVSRVERRARMSLFSDAYVWLVDAQAVRRFQGVEDGDNYSGWMRMRASEIAEAWFERAGRYESENWIFERLEDPAEPGIYWYSPR